MANEIIQPKEPMSQIRKKYFWQLAGRSCILLICLMVYIFSPEYFDILEGFAFFKKLSPLHLLWCIWMLDMIYQLFPVKKHIALGSQKLFKHFLRWEN